MTNEPQTIRILVVDDHPVLREQPGQSLEQAYARIAKGEAM